MGNCFSSIALVTVWMGSFPDYFGPWLISAAGNPSIDFYIFTNAVDWPEVPSNVHLVEMSLEEVKIRIQKYFDFDICLDKPYKLCDYKPSYGEVFSDYLSDYDFWGYCDIDLVWGNIRKFVTEDMLAKYERIFGRGHLTIMKNTTKVNSYYRTLKWPGTLDYRKVYTSPEVYVYDEYSGHNGGGTSIIMKKSGIPMYENDEWGKTSDTLRSYFWLASIGRFYVEYDNGNLYLKKGTRVLKENLYYHYYERKRIMKLVGNFDWRNNNIFFYISPGTFVDKDSFRNEFEPFRTFRYSLRLLGRRIYIFIGEPKGRLIARLLK